MPAITTRGFEEKETRLVGNLIAEVLEAPGDQNALNFFDDRISVPRRTISTGTVLPSRLIGGGGLCLATTVAKIRC
jgi:hypothetical protein